MDRTNTGEGRNRLWKEKSPYLLQHADNPVDWYPWGDEAFEAARRENKPVFLSIGYSTCHWCHVMAHESFEDRAVAEALNSGFISIKVDREERPDIDRVYMAACQSLTGSGGWPLTVFMTPEGKPFFAGTYFPKSTRYGQIGMLELLPKIAALWKAKAPELFSSADRLVSMLSEDGPTPRSERASEGLSDLAKLLDRCFGELAGRYDSEYGGFGGAPKFPSPHQLTFLLRYWKRTGKEVALSMAERTIRAMRLGGVYDHVGLGFHRYSTDRQWRVPHFEKMLYDQAMMALACLEAGQASGRGIYNEIAREIFSYVMLEMTSPEGGFYSAQDADSEGLEGRYYVWTRDEIGKVLDGEDARLAAALFNMNSGGNFPESGKIKPGGNILYMSRPPEELAGETGIEPEGLKKRLEQIRKRLYAARNERVKPLKDDKVLTDWNGLMIAAFAAGGRALNEPVYSEIAGKAAGFILERLYAGGGKLLHRFRAGHAAIDGMLDDYAYFTWGLIELYGATFDPGYLRRALEINAAMLRHFRDEDGGFHFTADFGEKLVLRRKDLYDGAIPSGNSVAMMNLLRLSRLTGNPELEEAARDAAEAFAGQVRQMPSAYCHFLSAADFLLGPSHEIVISGYKDSPDTARMLDVLRASYIPKSVVLLRPEGPGAEAIDDIAGFTAGMRPLDGRAAAYVCTNRTCSQPTSDPDKMLELLS